MPLSAGERLGPYEIIAPIGAGGMGEVYRARDPRLNRDVAIKISAERFSERFEREARAIAALNHPNICQIYDVVISKDAPNYLVMELVEGQNLKGPLPLATAVKYAAQIAEALDAAHEKSIVHRDLKPANIKITPAGVVKVLDFGLAKVAPASSSVSENSPTISMGMTQAGMILGTAAYMSPEQARGEPVDKRADIWAFGVVFFEMLAGQRMYEGKTVSDVLAAVLVKDPDLSKVPQEVRLLLSRCLEKDPKNRLRDIADAMPLVGQASGLSPSLPPKSQGMALRHYLPAILFLLAAATATYFWWRATQPVDHPLVRLDVDLGPDVSLATPTGTSNVIISPDGSRLVYFAGVAGASPKLYIRRFDQPKAAELPGTDAANAPFFSSDGQWVGFTTGGKLNKISVEGGAAVPIGDLGNTTGSSWGEDGYIVDTILLKSLFRVPSIGGAAASLADIASGELTFAAPQVLPGAKDILFFTYHGSNDQDKASIEVVTPAKHARKVVAQGGTSARYIATSLKSGYLLYTNKATLFAVPFDLENLEKRGTPIPVLDDVGYHPTTYEAQYDVSRNGTLVYRKAGAGTGIGMTTIQWVDAAGKRTPLVAKPGGYRSARLSPDGKRLAATVDLAGNEDIQIYDLQRETWTDLTFGTGRFYYDPTWSPDGQSVIFGSLIGLAWARADGANQLQSLTKQKIQSPASLSPDGKRLFFVEPSANNNDGQMFSASLENTSGQWKIGAPEEFLKGSLTGAAAFSPDGKWLAYETNSSGTEDVFVRAFPDNGSQWKISTNGGQNPLWSRTGHDLLYQVGDQEMAVSYSVQGSAFVVEKARVWLAKVGGTAQDISPDGKRLLILSQSDSPDGAKNEHEVVLIQNFLDELRRRVPLK